MAKKSGHPNRRRSAAGRRPPAKPNRRPPASQRPLPAGDTLATPNASPLRRTLERRSATLLVFLHRLPRWVPFVLMLGLLAAAMLLRGVLGGVFLGILALLLSWLAFLSWPNLSAGHRGFRVVSVLVVLAFAAYSVIQG